MLAGFDEVAVQRATKQLGAARKTEPPPSLVNPLDDRRGHTQRQHQDVVGAVSRARLGAYTDQAALGLPQPPDMPFENADLSPMARSFYADSKRVSNVRIKTELGVVLRYPTYREGLNALVENFKD